MKTRDKRGRTQRDQKGSIALETVCGIVIITIGLVCGSLLIANTAVASLYKEKLGIVTNKAAEYALEQPPIHCESKDPWSGGSACQLATEKMAKEMLENMGMPADKVKIVIQDKYLGAKKKHSIARAVEVTITVDNLGVIGSAEYLPKTFSLTDRALVVDPTPPVGAAGCKMAGTLKGTFGPDGKLLPGTFSAVQQELHTGLYDYGGEVAAIPLVPYEASKPAYEMVGTGLYWQVKAQ